MLVRRLRAARRDVVDVDVEGARRSRVQREALDAALLESLAQGDLLAGRLARIAVASGLQPAVELAVVEQQHAGPSADTVMALPVRWPSPIARSNGRSWRLTNATIWSRSPDSSASAGASSSSERTRAVRGSSRRRQTPRF